MPADGGTKADDPSGTYGKNGAAGAGASENAANTAILSLSAGNDDPVIGTNFSLLKARQAKATNSAITIKWNKAPGAKKYVIYGNRCGQKFKRISETGKLKWTQKKLKKGTYYKYLVMAVDGAGKVVATSKTLHIATAGGKVGNDKAVKVTGKKTVTLKKGKTYKIKAKAVPASKTKKVRRHRGLAYESSDETVATVSKKGVIKGVKNSTCTIYVYAQNGLYAQLKVKVK